MPPLAPWFRFNSPPRKLRFVIRAISNVQAVFFLPPPSLGRAEKAQRTICLLKIQQRQITIQATNSFYCHSSDVSKVSLSLNIQSLQTCSIKKHCQRALHYPVVFSSFIIQRQSQRGSDVRSQQSREGAPYEIPGLSSPPLLRPPLFLLVWATWLSLVWQRRRGSRFLVRAERSRCHEAVFNRISPSLLDIFHYSRAVSHFLLRYYSSYHPPVWVVAVWWTS